MDYIKKRATRFYELFTNRLAIPYIDRGSFVCSMIKNGVMYDMATNTNKGRFRQVILNSVVCSIGAAVGIFGGISALFAGLLCVVIHALLSNDKMFDGVATVLLIIAIPMILVGSVLLDEIEQKK